MRPTPHHPPGPAHEVHAEVHAEVGVLVTPLLPGSACRRAREVVREVLRAAGVTAGEVADAEIVVSELAANCEKHGRPPYEIRVLVVGGVPTWCEVVDGDPDLRWIPAVLSRPRVQDSPDALAEDGRGLLLVRELSQGRCDAYLTTTHATGTPAKAVAFALPTGDRRRRPGCADGPGAPAPSERGTVG
ncbi:ATP-binding protein [Sphaerisporangium corydalis]|uniref:ATP-binding protein n=1 Tax=Sphaerisporangium corydalis TaxID=1441875 RepID=A0ABV9EKR4_9ACTN|nr:ATP-binding protein [Sphaerisporangium corydalis]